MVDYNVIKINVSIGGAGLILRARLLFFFRALKNELMNISKEDTDIQKHSPT